MFTIVRHQQGRASLPLVVWRTRRTAQAEADYMNKIILDKTVRFEVHPFDPTTHLNARRGKIGRRR